MISRKHISTPVAVIAICCLGLVAVLTSGCKKAEDEPAAVEPPATETAKVVQAAVQFANVRCPIMGTAMTLASVPENLTRQYKGQKVAFCCAACPPAWDKLSDEQKAAKLAAAAVKKAD